MDDDQPPEVYDWLKGIGHTPSTESFQWAGNLTLVVPALNTLCVPVEAAPTENTMNINVTKGTDILQAFSFQIGPSRAANFTGTNCQVTFRQALFPVSFWQNTNLAGMSANDWEKDWSRKILYESASAEDSDVMLALASRMQGTLSALQAMLPNMELIHMSRALQATDPAIKSDAAGMSVIIGVLAQILLAISNKRRSPLPSKLPSEPMNIVTSYPLQWHVYGSGPRISWQWAIVIILATLIISLGYSLSLTARHRMGIGSWLGLGGMMVMAHKSTRLQDIDDEEKAQMQTYRVVEERSKGVVLESSTN